MKKTWYKAYLKNPAYSGDYVTGYTKSDCINKVIQVFDLENRKQAQNIIIEYVKYNN